MWLISISFLRLGSLPGLSEFSVVVWENYISIYITTLFSFPLFIITNPYEFKMVSLSLGSIDILEQIILF